MVNFSGTPNSGFENQTPVSYDGDQMGKLSRAIAELYI
jgi:hypothetical protein